MNTLAVLYRLLNLYSHAAHNLAAKSLFLQDHEFLAELYEQYDGYYDDVVERMIGLDQDVNIQDITVKACTAFSQMQLTVSENAEYFKKILELETTLQHAITQIYQQSSIGTQQLIGDQADKSEMRIYKLKQRIKK